MGRSRVGSVRWAVILTLLFTVRVLNAGAPSNSSEATKKDVADAERSAASHAKEYIQFVDIDTVGQIGPIRLAGPKMKAKLESGTEIPVWTQAQAARIAAELAMRNQVFGVNRKGQQVNRVVQLLSDVVMKGEDPLREEAGAGFQLCLVASSLDTPVHVQLDGRQRRARREDGAELVLFTPTQATTLFQRLLDEGLTIPEIAAVLSGFKVTPPKPPKDPHAVVISDCGTCTDGYVCANSGGCCAAGVFECRSCTLCSSHLRMILFH